MLNDPTSSISVEAFVHVLAFPFFAPAVPADGAKSAAAVFAVLIAALAASLMMLRPHAPIRVRWTAFGRAVLEFGGGWVAHRLWP